MRHVRDQLDGLTEKEAVEFLLDHIEQEQHDWKGRLAQINDRGDTLGIGKHGLSVLLYLWDRQGRTVLTEDLQRRVEQVAGVDYIPEDRIRGHIKRIRRCILNNGWPLKISTKHCLGYCLTLTDPDFNLLVEG